MKATKANITKVLKAANLNKRLVYRGRVMTEATEGFDYYHETDDRIILEYLDRTSSYSKTFNEVKVLKLQAMLTAVMAAGWKAEITEGHLMVWKAVA